MILYWLIWSSLRLYFFGWLGVRVDGLENVPSNGAAIACVNHRSWADPLLVGAVFPRHLFYMAKEEMFNVPALGLILRTVGAFPVRRHSADRRALRKAMALLASRRIVAVFPEGTRSRSGALGKAEPGAALLAAWSKSLVVPVAISGEYRRGHLSVRIGAPFRVAVGEARSARDLQAVADEQIMGAVRGLLVQGEPLGTKAVLGRH